jgi:potassium-transporting ATPase potassium-binding subunit
VQAQLLYALDHPGVSPALAWDTAVSFTANISWQNYAGEATLGHLVQAAGLSVEAFASAAVGLAAALALIRGLTRRQTGEVGNFWVDMTREQALTGAAGQAHYHDAAPAVAHAAMEGKETRETILVALTFLPALSLGPIAEGLG